MVSLWHWIRNLGVDSGLDPSEKKNVTVLNTLVAIVIPTQLSLIPTALYYRDFGGIHLLWVSAIMLSLQILVLVCSAFKKHTLARTLFAFSGLNNITLTAIVAGTETYGQFLMPAVVIGAFYYFPYRERKFVYAFVLLSILALLALEVIPFEPLVSLPAEALPTVRSLVIFWFSIITFGFLYYGSVIYREAEMNLAEEREKADSLLRNTLPDEIVERLKISDSAIAERFEEVSVLFSDIENFTSLSENLSPDELVSLLDRIFSLFDSLVEGHGVEKIKTIGDAYMVASGIPRQRPDHLHAIMQVALGMVRIFDEADGFGHNLQIRIGVHTGPVVAGVIGKKKFAYDLWGDVVNTASRMESHGKSGRIQVTRAVRDLLGHEFQFESRGSIDVKGKGPMEVFLLEQAYG